MTEVHEADEPEGAIQRCRRCGKVLTDNTALIEGNAVVLQTPGGHTGLTWWGTGKHVEVSTPEGTYSGITDREPTCDHDPQEEADDGGG